ncbi:putative GEM-like protein 8 [Capsicum chinense]|nr:putative GEM-like protein 8 [Capsicum chinense]
MMESIDCNVNGVSTLLCSELKPEAKETLKGKLSLGAKILQVGGLEKIFQQKFSAKDDEKLLKVSQCYLSTTDGPIAGLLFISTEKIAFCSVGELVVGYGGGRRRSVVWKEEFGIVAIEEGAGDRDLPGEVAGAESTSTTNALSE